MTYEITQPGVYDMLPAEYHADPVPGGSLSQSGAKLLLPPSCPALFKHERDNPPVSKAEFDLGHAAHRYVLGKGAELAVIDAPDWRTRTARDERAAAYEAGLTPLLAADHDRVLAMAEAVHRHPLAGKLFAAGTGKPEQALFWQDERTGVWRRALLDWLPQPSQRPQRLVVADYKTAASASPQDLQRAIYNHGYHLQGSWYEDGVRALGIHPDPVFLLVLQEKTPPYLVTVVQMPAQAMQAGRELGRRAIDIYQRCVETDTWPPYSEQVEVVEMPIWLENQYIAEEIIT